MRSVRRKWMVGLLIGLCALVLGSRFYPKLETIEVFGNVHHSQEDIMRLANTEPGAPFFWITKGRVRGLELDPWIMSATVYRHWPNTVSITITERQPVFTNGFLSYARDGTPLPGLKKAEQDALIQVSGWGESRFDEVLTLIDYLAEFDLKVLSYSPAGFQIQLGDRQLFTPSAVMLQDNWSSFLSQQGTRVSVYPWGVSATHD